MNGRTRNYISRIIFFWTTQRYFNILLCSLVIVKVALDFFNFRQWDKNEDRLRSIDPLPVEPEPWSIKNLAAKISATTDLYGFHMYVNSINGLGREFLHWNCQVFKKFAVRASFSLSKLLLPCCNPVKRNSLLEPFLPKIFHLKAELVFRNSDFGSQQNPILNPPLFVRILINSFD